MSRETTMAAMKGFRKLHVIVLSHESLVTVNSSSFYRASATLLYAVCQSVHPSVCHTPVLCSKRLAIKVAHFSCVIFS